MRGQRLDRSGRRCTRQQRLPYRERGVPVPYGAALAVDRAFYAANTRSKLPLPGSAGARRSHRPRCAGGGDRSRRPGIGLRRICACCRRAWQSAADLPKITVALAERGYTAEQLKKLLGGNLLRVFGEVQAEAAGERIALLLVGEDIHLFDLDLVGEECAGVRH